MYFKVKQFSSKTWEVIAMEGPMHERALAMVEGITLSDVDFFAGFIVGTPEAIWGAQINEDAYDYPDTVLALRLNRVFAQRGKMHLVVRHGDEWLDAVTKQRVTRASSAMILGNNVMVSVP